MKRKALLGPDNFSSVAARAPIDTAANSALVTTRNVAGDATMAGVVSDMEAKKVCNISCYLPYHSVNATYLFPEDPANTYPPKLCEIERLISLKCSPKQQHHILPSSRPSSTAILYSSKLKLEQYSSASSISKSFLPASARTSSFAFRSSVIPTTTAAASSS